METVDTSRGDVEIGITDAIQQHYMRHVVQRKPISQKKLDFEQKRPRWLREFLAEMTGVFFYGLSSSPVKEMEMMLTFCSQVFPGISAIATFTLAGAAPPTNANIAAYGSLLQVGFAFSLGIAFAIITCGPTSGGHFNPAVTLCLAYWQGFPWRKVPYYIFAQILGSFLAAMVVMGKTQQT